MSTEKTVCRTPNASGTTSIPSWKFEVLSVAICAAIDDAGEAGILNKDLKDAVRERLSAAQLDQLGKLGWHVITVKLELEVRGVITRVAGKSPQLLKRSGGP